MPSQRRVALSLVLAIAVVATLASGRHLDVGRRPPKAKLPDRPMPTVSPSAVERGCVAWGEKLADCLTGGGDTYEWGKPNKF